METQFKKMSDDELNRIGTQINDLTETMFDKLTNSGVNWFPVVLHTTLNVLAMATEMSRYGGNPDANLIDLTQTFCKCLIEQAERGATIKFTPKDQN